MTQYDTPVIIRDLYVIPLDNNYLLYAPFTKTIICVNEAVVKILRYLSDGDPKPLFESQQVLKKLIDARILIDKGDSNDYAIFNKETSLFKPDGITLLLTNKCSMRCMYCYGDGGKDQRTMSWDLARASINWIQNEVRGRNRFNYHLCFHGGGEITTVGDLFIKCVDYVRRQASQNGMSVRINAGTNGVMNEAMAEWFVTNLDGATVSLDGIPEIQNVQRPLSNGDCSSQVVEETLKRFDEYEFNYGIRMTVTSESIAYMANSIEYICNRFKTKTIQVEPLFLAGRAKANNMESVDPVAFVEMYRKAEPIATGFGKELKYSGARLGILTNKFCQAVGQSVAITVDGLITSCYEVTDPADPRSDIFIYGSVDQITGKVNIDNERIEQLASLTVENKPHCAKCFCKWHCAGDCPAKLALYGSPWAPETNPSRCYVNRELTKDQIIKCLEKNTSLDC